LTVLLKNSPVCCGLWVLAGELLGIFDIAVSPEYRGWGSGRLAMEGILDWGRESGAETTWLRVFLDNTPAKKLCKKMGFGGINKYWTRSRITEYKAIA